MIAILNELAFNYSKIKPKNYIGNINLIVDECKYIINMDEHSVNILEGENENPMFTLTMDLSTFNNLKQGKWNGMTAGGKARMSDKSPVEFIFPQNKKIASDTLQILYHIGTHFFSNSYPSKTNFGPEHARKIHGGNAVALAYGHGVRHAYYCISNDEQINSDEKDPWWQCFTIIGGKGVAIIDGVKVELKRGVAVHVPPFVTHTFKASKGELLELVWVAYGNKA